MYPEIDANNYPATHADITEKFAAAFRVGSGRVPQVDPWIFHVDGDSFLIACRECHPEQLTIRQAASMLFGTFGVTSQQTRFKPVQKHARKMH